MPRLRDYFDYDLDVFFDNDEFATSHNINGADMDVVVDNDLIEERMKSNQNNFNDPQGIFKADVLFHVKKTDFGEKPAVGQTIIFDSERYLVSEVEEEEKTYTITLVGNFS